MNQSHPPHQWPQTTQPNGRSQSLLKKLAPFIWVALAFTVLGAGGYGVLAYLKHNNAAPYSNTGAATNPGSSYNGGGANAGNGPERNGQSCSMSSPCTGSSNANQQPPVIGTVTAFSATSITVKSSDGSSQTLAITSNTQESSGPGQATAYNPSDIHMDESVEIVTGPGNQAMFIVLNHT